MQFTLSDIWAHMGFFARLIVGVMVVMSLASVFVAGERLLTFNKSRDESRAFASKMGALLAKGDLLGAAGTKMGANIGYLGRVINAGLAAFKGNQAASSEFIFESVARALERQSGREIATLKRGLPVLATVGSITPFVGLLGTVVGIINAFQSMAASGSGGLGTVSAGIAEALATTAIGLGVAIVAVMFYNYLQSWVDARSVDLSESANEFLDVVARKLAEGKGKKAESEEEEAA
ncbi:MAG: MotA/TolQ/ExbB proton channel family protein [Minicystis sp.]